MVRSSKFLKRWAAALAFLLLALAGGYAINVSAKHTASDAALVVYHSQYKSCLRSNNLRRELNRRLKDTQIERNALVEFLSGAANARYANYRATRLKADLTAARTYSRLEHEVRTGVHYSRVSIINCAAAVPKP